MRSSVRVWTSQGPTFETRATERLSEYLVKGFTMDDQRLKNPQVEGSGAPDYFDELLERIRKIVGGREELDVCEVLGCLEDVGDLEAGFGRVVDRRCGCAAGGVLQLDRAAGGEDQDSIRGHLSTGSAYAVT